MNGFIAESCINTSSTQAFGIEKKKEVPQVDITCADILVKYFSALNVPYVFGVPGGNIDLLCGALSRSQKHGGPRWLLTRSELGAGYMAEGFTRESGILGVCGATSGPGATGLMTPVSNAYANNIPMLVITGQTAIATFGRGGMQETSGAGVDIMMMFNGCTRYNSLISHPAQLLHKLFAATSHALGATPGPVHLSIPSDILSAKISEGKTLSKVKSLVGHLHPPEQPTVEKLAKHLKGAKKGVVVLGLGCEGAMPHILRFAESKQWPIVTIPMARGLISHSHPLFYGVFGTAGHETARKVLVDTSTEVLLVIGAELDENATCGWESSPILSEKIIHINENPEQLERSHMACLNVLGSPRLVFEQILQNHRNIFENKAIDYNKNYKKEIYYHKQKGRNFDKAGYMGNVRVLHKEDLESAPEHINPRKLFWELSQKCPLDTRVYADAGNSLFWAIHYWRQNYAYDNNRNLLKLSMNYAPMAWAISASIGNKLAAPEYPVMCITGDGSYLMSGQEITVARQQEINIVMVVLNDSFLGTVRHGQKLRQGEVTANQLPKVNYAVMACGLGIESYRIETYSALQRLDFTSLFKRKGPVLIDIVIDPEIPPPIGERVRALKRGEGTS